MVWCFARPGHARVLFHAMVWIVCRVFLEIPHLRDFFRRAQIGMYAHHPESSYSRSPKDARTPGHDTTKTRHRRESILWLRRLESNERPPGYEPGELPLLHSAVSVQNIIKIFFEMQENREICKNCFSERGTKQERGKKALRCSRKRRNYRPQHFFRNGLF